MANELWRWCRGAGALLACTALAGCSHFQAPQYDALKRDLEVDPTVRVRAYDTCRARAHLPDDLDACMKAEGYRFVSHTSQDYRASECWSDHYAGTFPKAYCYDVGSDDEK